MLVIQLALAAVALYIAVIAVVALMQTSLLFPTGLVANADVQLPASAQRLSIKASDETELQGVYLPAAPAGTVPRPGLLLGFGGNAWNAASLATFLKETAPGHDVVVFHYRGYAPSGGKPSTISLLQDALVIHDSLAELASSRSVVAVGISIGSGPAIHLARHRKLSGVILITPFDSLAGLASHHYWWAPVRLLLRHRMEVAEDAAEVDEPVAIIAAQRDSIVPGERSEALRSRVRRLVLYRVIPNTDHNSLYDHPGFAAALREAVALIQSADDPSR